MSNSYQYGKAACCSTASMVKNTEKKNKLPVEKSPFFSLSQLSERLAARFTFIARIYFLIFYRGMLIKELALANLKPGASILHIGGGAYPFTALFLAQRGFIVDACDCSSSAVDISKQLVAKSGLSNRVNIFLENGCTIDSSQYDAVWISLNICPKKRVLEQTWKSLSKGSILVYRKLPLWLAIFGKKDVAFNGDGEEGTQAKRALSGFGAESVVITKGSQERQKTGRFIAVAGGQKISAKS